MERRRLVSRRASKSKASAPRKPSTQASDTSGSRGPGRPRSEKAHGAILDAAMSLIREMGYDAVTMEALAARAGVGKATVYRRWTTKETLVAEALERFMRTVPTPDTGSTEGDLLAAMRSTVKMYEDPATAALLSGLIAAMVRSERIAAAVRTGFVATRREAIRQVLLRGVRRGDLHKGLDLELAIDLLNGPLFYRFLVTGERIDTRLIRGVIEVILRGLAPT